tara:strand:+ start:77 stop:2257 length:2181 start_codon:yes stop_codon:yes gene_type:complete
MSQVDQRFGNFSCKDMYEVSKHYPIRAYNFKSADFRFDVQEFLYGFKKKFGKETNLRFFYMGTKSEFENSCLSLTKKFSKIHPDWFIRQNPVLKHRDAREVAKELYNHGKSALQEFEVGHGSDGTITHPTTLAKTTIKQVYHSTGTWNIFDVPNKRDFPTEKIDLVDINPNETKIPNDTFLSNQFSNLETGHHLFLLHDNKHGFVCQDLFRTMNTKNKTIMDICQGLHDIAEGKQFSSIVGHGTLQTLQGLDFSAEYLKPHDGSDSKRSGQSCNFLVTDEDCVPLTMLRISHYDQYDYNSREGKRHSEVNPTTQYSIHSTRLSSESQLRNTRDVSNYNNSFSTFFKKIRRRELNDKLDFIHDYCDNANHGLKLEITEGMTTKHIFEPSDTDLKDGSRYKRRLDKEDLHIGTVERDGGFNLTGNGVDNRDSRWLILKLLIDNMTDGMKKNISSDKLKTIDSFIKSKSVKSAFTNNTISLDSSTSDILENVFGSDLIKYMFDDALPNYLELANENTRINKSFVNYVGLLPLGKNGCYGFMYLESYEVGVVPSSGLVKDTNKLLIRQEEINNLFNETNTVQLPNSNNMFLYKGNYRNQETRLFQLKHIDDITKFNKDLFGEQFTNLTFARMEEEFDREGFVSYEIGSDGKKEYRGGKHYRKAICNYIPERDMILFHQYANSTYSNDWIIHPIGWNKKFVEDKFHKSTAEVISKCGEKEEVEAYYILGEN